MLRIRYDSGLQTVELDMSTDVEAWPKVRRVFEESGQGVTVISAFSLRLPVWSFLGNRKALGYVVRRCGIKLELDADTKDLLEASIRNENAFLTAAAAVPANMDDLQTGLCRAGFNRRLTAEQVRNVSRLVALPAGATFSVPGAGKTTEALSFYFYKRRDNTRLLVVCPKNAFAVWEEQISLCVGDAEVAVRLTGGEERIRDLLRGDPKIMLITYQQLPNVKHLIGAFMAEHQTFMYLDESHRIKRGVGGAWASAVLQLAHLPVAKLIMTGTPLPNDQADLVSQFNFLFPEVDADRESVVGLMKPVFVRTTKGELGLPEVQRRYRPIQMRPRQRQLYEMMRSEEARRLADLAARDRNALRAFGRSVMRLLQMASNPALLGRQGASAPQILYDVLREGDSPKVEYACWKARQLARRGQKCIIWSNFVENVELLAGRLADLGAEYIHGGVEAGSDEELDTRENRLKRFRTADDAFVLVANPAACAESISLHDVCHYAIYVDRTYNAAQYLQSEDRIHRLGLPHDAITNVEILYIPDTVDESVRHRLEVKVGRMAEILEDNSLSIEPVETDPDDEGLTMEDAEDFLKHLRGE